MILYFMRHGLAGDRESWEGDDVLRPLTRKGVLHMKREARSIDQMKLSLDLVITSPLVRAAQTAKIVAKRLGMQKKLIQDERLSPGFGLQELAGILETYPDAGAILLVGHEPDFSQTLSELIGGGKIVCKKGGLARVDLVSQEPLQGELLWLLPPKALI